MLSSECGQVALSFSPIEPRKTFQEETARPCLISGFTSGTRRGCGSCPVPHSPYPPSASTNNALPYCPIKCCPDSKLAYLFIEPRSSFSCGPSLVRSSTSPRRKGTSLSAPGGRGGQRGPWTVVSGLTSQSLRDPLGPKDKLGGRAARGLCHAVALRLPCQCPGQSCRLAAEQPLP